MENPLIVAGVIGIIISILKNWNIPKKYYFVVSVLLGLSYYFYWFTQGTCLLVLAIENGIIAGGTASGIYSGVKTISTKPIVDKIINPLTLNRGKNEHTK